MIKDRSMLCAILMAELFAMDISERVTVTDGDLGPIAGELIDAILPKECSIVDDEHIAAMERDSAFLRYLEAAGVDNWEGYDQAVAMRGEE